MVQVRPVPRDASPLATGLGGAGLAARGFQQMDLEQKESLRLLEQLKLAQDQHDLDVRDWLAQRADARREQDEKSRQRQDAGDLFKALGAMNGQESQELPPGIAGPPAPTQMFGPDTWKMQNQAIGEAVRSGALTIPQGLSALRLLGAQQQTALRRVASDELRRKIVNGIASGEWNPKNALGLELDLDGDGKPDPISETPQILLEMLDDPQRSPESVAALHDYVLKRIAAEKARIDTRERKAAEADQMRIEAQGITPEANRLAIETIGKWRRDEYEQTEQGLRDFKQDFEQALVGNVPIMLKKSGVKVYVSEAEAKRAEIGEEVDPQFERVKATAGILDSFIGPMPKYDPEFDDEENERARQRYLQDFRELSEALGLTPPKEKGMMPSRAGVLTGGAQPQQSQQPTVTRPPPLTSQIVGPGQSTSSSGAADPRERALELLGGRKYESLSVQEKAEMARKLRAEFGAAANRPGNP